MCRLALATSASLPTESRIICEIERTLRRGASTPHTGYNKDKVEGHRLEIQEILGTLNAPNSPSDGTPSVGEQVTNLAPVDLHTASLCESGTPLAAFADFVRDIDYFLLLNSIPPACGRLIRRAFTLHELPSLIESIFLSKDEGDTIRRLIGHDAQTFIDVIDEVHPTLARYCKSVDKD